MIRRALTIAGSDSGGGAGIQADLKTFMAYGVFGMSAITAITAQNTIGVQKIAELPLDIIEAQITSVITDIGVDAVKTGMLANPDIVELVAQSIRKYDLKNIVVDPVMVAKSGDSLLSDKAIETIKTRLLPLADVITPNLPEAEVLLRRKIDTLEDMEKAARDLHSSSSQTVVIKGGHLAQGNEMIDIVYDGRDTTKLRGVFIKTKNTHGTGCTFASAIAAGLAKGYEPKVAIRTAKLYISEAIRTALPLGKGHGPTNHYAGLNSKW
jgi:hydroxymethylpyrimidine/phosphomethylpyrimidine kinase